MIAVLGRRYQGRACALVAFLALVVTFLVARHSPAAVTFSTQHGAAIDDFDHLISSSDLIQGKNTLNVDVFENPGDLGWHPANTNPADQLEAFTDGAGMLGSGLTGLLNDLDPPNTGVGIPVKIVEYPFDIPVDIGRIHIFTGNTLNADGRIFSTTYIEYSTDFGFNYQPLGYFQSDPSGTINNEALPEELQRKSTMVSIFDDSSATMLTGVTNIIFNLYPVDNTGGQMRDPFDGVNPFTGIDDGLSGAFVSPLVLEIDVLPPIESLDGDFNGDLVVDAADYVLWRKTGEPLGGYEVWRANFGNTISFGAGSGSAAAVPEPGVCSTLAALAVVLLAGRTFSRLT